MTEHPHLGTGRAPGERTTSQKRAEIFLGSHSKSGGGQNAWLPVWVLSTARYLLPVFCPGHRR